MAELRAACEALGYTNVGSYIQSGNLVFTATKSITPNALQAAIASEFGIDIHVVLRTERELEQVVNANPFAAADLSKVHVGFMAEKPVAAKVEALDADRFRPEEFVVRGCDLYLHLPNGMD